jgi:hypothetical protein
MKRKKERKKETKLLNKTKQNKTKQTSFLCVDVSDLPEDEAHTSRPRSQSDHSPAAGTRVRSASQSQHTSPAQAHKPVAAAAAEASSPKAKLQTGELEGWLQKKGDDWIGWWRHRWFVLQKGRVLFYPDKEGNPHVMVCVKRRGEERPSYLLSSFYHLLSFLFFHRKRFLLRTFVTFAARPICTSKSKRRPVASIVSMAPRNKTSPSG